MTPYANRGGDSGVAAFEVGADFIVVQFTTGARYLYNHAATGAANIARMKELALDGHGLNEFINRHVRKLYARRLV